MYRLMTVSDKVRVRSGLGGHVLQGRPSESGCVGGERGGEHRARLVGADRRDPWVVDTDEFCALGEPTLPRRAVRQCAVTLPASNNTSIVIGSLWSAHSLTCVASSVMSTGSPASRSTSQVLGDDAVDSAPFAGTDVVVERLAENAVGELVPLVDLHHQLLADQPVETLDHPPFGNPGDRSDQIEFSRRHVPNAAMTLATFASVLPIWAKNRWTTAVRGRSAG